METKEAKSACIVTLSYEQSRLLRAAVHRRGASDPPKVSTETGARDTTVKALFGI